QAFPHPQFSNTPLLHLSNPTCPAQRLLTLCNCGAGLIGGGSAMAGGLGEAPQAESGFHSPVPSICEGVCQLMRSSAIHSKTLPPSIGPYTFWSAPITRYLRVLSNLRSNSFTGV